MIISRTEKDGAAEPRADSGTGGRFAIYGLVVLALTVFVNALDQVVLPAVSTGVQAEFHLSDGQVGMLLGAFVVALALGALPLGYLADRRSRRLIIAAGVFVWSLATVASGLAQGFGQMLAARAVVGIGEASSQPAGTSLLGDYFPTRSRGRAMAVVIAAAGLGTGGGLILAGVVGFHQGWRTAFFFAGVPGLVVAALALTLREPARGAAEAAGTARAHVGLPVRAAVLRLVRNRTYLVILVAGTFGLLAQGTSQLTILYLNRRFGLDAQSASALTGSPLLVGGVVGTPLYGWLIDWRSRRSERAAVEIALVAGLVAAAASAVMFAAPTVPVFAAGAIVFGVVQWAFILAPFVVIQNVVTPDLRAGATAITVTAGRLFGSALGPVLVGGASDALGSNLGLSLLMFQPAALVLSAVFAAAALPSFGRDAAAMGRAWAAGDGGG